MQKQKSQPYIWTMRLLFDEEKLSHKISKPYRRDEDQTEASKLFGEKSKG